MRREEETRMRMPGRHMLGLALLGTILAVASVLGHSRTAGALEAGDPAPEFKLWRDSSRHACCR
jgi:hypothetical protein